jgi:glycosyltransferase involved in cell wall biosynthesis
MTGPGVPTAPADCVLVPEGASRALASRVPAAASSRRPRIAYVAGPGDLMGTHAHWLRGEHDPRVPVVTYSGMFYSLVEKLDAEALVLHQGEQQGTQDRGRFTFVRAVRTPRRGRAGYLLSDLQYAWRLLRLLRAFQPDIVVIGSDAPRALLQRLPRRMRLILSAHNSYWPMGRPPTAWRQRLKLWLAARALRRIDAAVCTSPECRRQVASLRGDDRGLLVEMPQLPEWHPAQPRGDAPAMRLLFAGRIEASKGVFDLLRAFAGLAARHPGLSLAYAGDGSELEALRRAVEASPAAARIRVLGRLSASALRVEMAQSDLLLCPTRSSFNEGLALVVLEAAALGIPGIASSVVPAAEVAGPACLRFEADDAAALAQAIEAVVASPERYQSMQQATLGIGAQMLDRSRSWGSCLCRAMLG